jgi:hypothetical protein
MAAVSSAGSGREDGAIRVEAGRGFILTSDAVLAIASVAVLTGIIFSSISAPAHPSRFDYFNSDVISVIEKLDPDAAGIPFMFETSAKCGSVSLLGETGQTLFERCKCGGSRSVDYGVIWKGETPALLKIESCPE